MLKEFQAAVAKRRTTYAICKESVLSDDQIQELIEHGLKHAPSAFNSQSARAVLLLGSHHDKLWNITLEALRKVVAADQFAVTEQKILSFQNGYGTVLFFDDTSVVKQLQAAFPSYQTNFPIWAQQSNGMTQYVIWTALDLAGFGVSLQHYNELIESDVKKEWNIPDTWKLIGQMPFGKPVAPPEEKEFQPLESRLKVFK